MVNYKQITKPIKLTISFWVF